MADGYPLVTNITMENHHVQWVNPLFLGPFSIAMFVYQMVYLGFGKKHDPIGSTGQQAAKGIKLVG